MQSAIYHGRRDVRVEDVPDPRDPGPDELLLDVSTCGICGSDLHEYVAGPIMIPDDEPHPVTGERLPLPMGHEFAGAVLETGEAVSAVEVGDHVVVNPIEYCGECRYCRTGKYHVCESVGLYGITGGAGGFSERAVVSAERAVPLADGLTPEQGALVEPFSVGLHAVDLAGLRPGASVAVFGTGPIGLTVVQAARAAGAGDVYAVEPRDARRRTALEVGADVGIDPTDADPVAEVLSASDGGVDATFEVAGVGQTLRDAVATAKHDGTVVVVSLFEEAVTFDPTDVVTAERTLVGSAMYHGGDRSARDFGAVMEMFADGRLDPDPLVTGRIGLDDIVEEGFEALEDPDDDHVKILVDPDE